jgi:1,2-diacylglycerol 3-alpha-glucosyltransferase
VVNEAMAAGLPCLVSSACGCAVDLIEHGVTGWCFDPTNTDQLCALMHTAESQDASDRVAMVQAASRRVKWFSPQAFAEGLEAVVQRAMLQPLFSKRAALVSTLLTCR